LDIIARVSYSFSPDAGRPVNCILQFVGVTVAMSHEALFFSFNCEALACNLATGRRRQVEVRGSPLLKIARLSHVLHPSFNGSRSSNSRANTASPEAVRE